MGALAGGRPIGGGGLCGPTGSCNQSARRLFAQEHRLSGYNRAAAYPLSNLPSRAGTGERIVAARRQGKGNQRRVEIVRAMLSELEGKGAKKPASSTAPKS